MQTLAILFIVYVLSIWLYAIASIEEQGYRGNNWVIMFLMTIFVTVVFPVLALATIFRVIRAKMACNQTH